MSQPARRQPKNRPGRTAHQQAAHWEGIKAVRSSIERLMAGIGLVSALVALAMLLPRTVRSGASPWGWLLVAVLIGAVVVHTLWLARRERFSTSLGIMTGAVGGVMALACTLVDGTPDSIANIAVPACLIPLGVMLRGLIDRLRPGGITP